MTTDSSSRGLWRGWRIACCPFNLDASNPGCFVMTADVGNPAPRRRRARLLPYILSLPALVVCIGILIPFVTAVYYSLLRYRLNMPAMKGFIWFGNYQA